LTEVFDEFRQAVDFNTLSLSRNVKGIIAFCTLIVVANIVAYTHPRFQKYRKARPVILFDEDGIAQQPNRDAPILLFGPAVGYTVFYIFTMIGVILYFQGYAIMVDLMKETLSLDLSSVETLSYLFGIAVVLIDTSFLLFIWFPTRVVWQTVNAAYYDLIGDDEMVEYHRKRMRCGGNAALITFQFMYGVLFNSLILGVLTVLIGSINIGIAYTIGEICINLVGALDNACLNLEAWGIVIECGPDFNQFCNK